MPIAIKINPKDNVVVALHPIAKGTAVSVDNTTITAVEDIPQGCLLYTSPSPRDMRRSRMPSSA